MIGEAQKRQRIRPKWSCQHIISNNIMKSKDNSLKQLGLISIIKWYRVHKESQEKTFGEWLYQGLNFLFSI